MEITPFPAVKNPRPCNRLAQREGAVAHCIGDAWDNFAVPRVAAGYSLEDSVMPNTPDRGKQQPNTDQQRKRQQLNDAALQEEDDDSTEEEGRIEAPGTEEDEESGTLRTDDDDETGEDEDLPDDETTQVNSNPGNFANDPDKASKAGRKGGRR
jgi:general stress protein YciG